MANVFTWVPTYGSAVTKTASVKRVRFGDGYEQRATMGLNSLRRKWEVVFANRPNIRRASR